MPCEPPLSPTSGHFTLRAPPPPHPAPQTSSKCATPVPVNNGASKPPAPVLSARPSDSFGSLHCTSSCCSLIGSWCRCWGQALCGPTSRSACCPLPHYAIMNSTVSCMGGANLTESLEPARAPGSKSVLPCALLVPVGPAGAGVRGYIRLLTQRDAGMVRIRGGPPPSPPLTAGTSAPSLGTSGELH